ncbi:MAG: diaminopimelate decarboxylase [Actinomycetota bacterium]|nr:diaminopimelate decarboxylase [Actinomycetota bacterium]
MTLAQLIPSLRTSLPHPIESWLWPTSTHHLPAGDLSIGGVSLMALVNEHGTACQVFDIGEFRDRAAQYRRAYGDGDVSYAGKALLTRAVCQWVEQAGLRLDVCTAGELHVALSAGFPPHRIALHGNAKPADLLSTAISAGVGRIIVDSLDEIELLSTLACDQGHQKVLLRVIPGVDAHTHPAITTGIEGQKFGLSVEDGSLTEAVARLLATPHLELVGLHCHLGSQIASVEPYLAAATAMVDQLVRIHNDFGITLAELNLGGGFAIAYHSGDMPLDVSNTASRIRHTVRSACQQRSFAMPRLAVEPGRSVAGPAGVTVYRVLTVKHSAGRRWVMVDGGMADNPRPTLYGARYTARLLGRLSGAHDEHMTVAGQHCEAGDVLIADALLPDDIHRGDLLIIPATGAYHHAMSSNYNHVPRPPIIGVDSGASRTLIRRETFADLTVREVAPL